MRQLNCLLVFCVLFLASGLAAGQCAPCTIWTPSSAPTIADSGDGAGDRRALGPTVVSFLTQVRGLPRIPPA